MTMPMNPFYSVPATTLTQKCNKIVAIGDSLIMACAGSVGMGQMFALEIEESLRKMHIKSGERPWADQLEARKFITKAMRKHQESGVAHAKTLDDAAKSNFFQTL